MEKKVAHPNLVTVEEYERFREEPGYRSEISRGWLVREPQPGALHGEVTGRLYVALDAFVREHGLGKVTNQTGFQLSRRNNSVADLQEKVIEYFEAGTLLVWVIEPRTRTVTVYHSLADIAVLREHDVLEGGDLLAGFSISVSQLFEW